MARNGVQIQTAMRLCAMQKDCYRRYRHVGEDERNNDVAPPRQIDQARSEKIRNIYQECSRKKNSYNNGDSLRRIESDDRKNV